MRRALLAAAGLVALLVPVGASAKVVELGDQKRALVAPSCPTGAAGTNCTIVLTEVTAMETITDGIAYPTKVTAPGQIVAFTLGLSNLSSSRTTEGTEIHGLDGSYGGVPLASIAVLRPVKKIKKKKAPKYTYKLVAESLPVHLIPYLGQVAQFPLSTTLSVKKGDVVALSVPSWAPVLSINLPAKSYAYRQSRSGSAKTCATASTAGPQAVGKTTSYNCDYAGTRVEYAATEVTAPTPTPGHFALDIGP